MGIRFKEQEFRRTAFLGHSGSKNSTFLETNAARTLSNFS